MVLIAVHEVIANNSVAATLAQLGVIDPGSLEPLYPRTRDREDISVWRCAKSGVILLSQSDHVHERFYQEKEHPELHALGSRSRVVSSLLEDTQRRVDSFGKLVLNNRWLDVGTGAGAILDELEPRTALTAAVEPQSEFRVQLQDRGYEVYERLAQAPSDSFDIITAFHVVEHLSEPLEELNHARRALIGGGRIVVEVPHARDALIGMYDSEAFHGHTFWSEHLVLHTRSSLATLLEAAGFSGIEIGATQRYSVSNHLYWLAKGQPGGHIRWAMLETNGLIEAYEAALARIDATDTLIAFAEVEQ